MNNRANAGKTWLREEYADLRDRFATGMTLEQLADAHGRTAGAILGKLLEMGLLVHNRNGFYYKVESDPWTNHLEAKAIEEGLDLSDTRYRKLDKEE